MVHSRPIADLDPDGLDAPAEKRAQIGGEERCHQGRVNERSPQSPSDHVLAGKAEIQRGERVGVSPFEVEDTPVEISDW